MKKKKPDVSKYEIMCLFQKDEKQKKEELIKKIQQLTSSEPETKDLETEKLASWPSWSVRVENYLLLHLKVNPEKIAQVEKILQKIPNQYLLINLDKEKYIKIKKKILNKDNSPINASEEEEKSSSSKPTEENQKNQSIE